VTAMSELIARQQEQTARQDALLTAIRQDPDGRWKSGRAVTALRAAGHHPISLGTASRLLQALTWAGHLIAHDEKGVRYYTATGAAR
jgi:hypothetical protein